MDPPHTCTQPTWIARQSIRPSERELRKVTIMSSVPGLYVSNTRAAISSPCECVCVCVCVCVYVEVGLSSHCGLIQHSDVDASLL